MTWDQGHLPGAHAPSGGLSLPPTALAKPASITPSPAVRVLTSLSQARKHPDRRRGKGLTVAGGAGALSLPLRSSSPSSTFKCASHSGRETELPLQEPSFTAGGQPSPGDRPHVAVITAFTAKPRAAASNPFPILPTLASEGSLSLKHDHVGSQSRGTLSLEERHSRLTAGSHLRMLKSFSVLKGFL